jgi:uncharacterized protein (TIGR03503 family)
MDSRIFLGLMLCFFACSALADNTPAHFANDLRIVIDTSGSMKQTDPHNLRIPAVKLLANLLPNDSRAAIWLFDSTAQELVPAGVVDAAWKEKAIQSSAKIQSKGLFTNIEEALAAASADWNESAPDGVRRNLILLTDGRVDVSKNPQDSVASRERIFTELLPKLQQAGVQVHSIALSDQSDQELMRQIALSTGGWNETILDAEQLQRSFVHMFNKAAPHDSVPLQENRFAIDASIKEFTVLALLRGDSKPTRLLGPDQSEITQEHLPPSCRWVHDAGYDLITVAHPAAGTWQLVADIDPSNQVLVATNLKMNVNPPPNHLGPDETPSISASFSENGNLVDRAEFLKLLSIKVTLIDQDQTKDFPIPMDSIHLGQFTLNIGDPLHPGEYTLKIHADGKTFQREAEHSFKVLDNLIAVERSHDEGHGSTITLTPNASVLAADSLTVHATLTDQAHQTKSLELKQHEHDWVLTVPEPGPDDRWVVNFSASAKTLDEKEINVPLKPITFSGAATAQPEPAPALGAPPDEHPPPSPPNWKFTAAITGAVNLILLIGAVLGFRAIRKKQAANLAQLLNKI